jgi:NADH-quinone oxidoreductase subunit L
MELTDISVWLVWILPLVSSIFVPLIARLGEKTRNAFVIAISVITAFFAFTLIPAVESGVLNVVVPWIPGNVGAGVYIDPLSVLFACLVAFFGLIIAVYSLGYMKHEQNLTRYYFFLLLFIGSMIGLVVSDNFLQMFIFWEMVGLCSYSLISFWNNRPESVKSGNKVFLMTRIGDISLLAAIGIIYATIGTFSFRGTIDAIVAGQFSAPLLVTVAFLVLGGAIAKSAQLPMHTWLYSAMEAPTSVSALLHAATMVKAGIYLIARFILIAAPMIAALESLWLPTVAWIGVLTAFLGATLAFYTSDIKGVLAYSTVSQLGFMMAALGASGAHAAESLGWFGSLFHMMSHAFFEGLGFLLAGGIIHALGTRDMRLMGGLKKAMPISFILAVIMIITTSGLPPFAAFFSKGAVIESIMETGNIWQTIVIFATTMITFAYSLRFLKLVFQGEESEHLKKLHVHEAPKIMLAPAFALAVLCIVWGFMGPLLGGFLHFEGEFSLIGSFLSIETPIFLSLMVPVALIIYVTYYKKSEFMTKLRSTQNPLSTLLKHGYFFDGLYEGGVATGVSKLSGGLRVFEEVGLGRFPQMIAGFVISAAMGVHKYLDVFADQLLNIVALRTLRSASKMEKVPSSSMQHYLAAALLGFILILILIIVTVGV